MWGLSTLLNTLPLQFLQRFAQAGNPEDIGAGCVIPRPSFFGLPGWYEYLNGQIDPVSKKCIPVLKSFNDIWAIALAVIDILLRVGGFLAVVYVIYGGVRLMLSQGQPDRISEARGTIQNAIIGLVITIIAIIIVNFIGATIK